VAKGRDTVREYLREIGSRGGKAGGPKGGRARAAKLTPERRREIARKAARARWAKRDKLK
jgi:general stress protein YciG